MLELVRLTNELGELLVKEKKNVATTVKSPLHEIK